MSNEPWNGEERRSSDTRLSLLESDVRRLASGLEKVHSRQSDMERGLSRQLDSHTDAIMDKMEVYHSQVTDLRVEVRGFSSRMNSIESWQIPSVMAAVGFAWRTVVSFFSHGAKP